MERDGEGRRFFIGDVPSMDAKKREGILVKIYISMAFFLFAKFSDEECPRMN